MRALPQPPGQLGVAPAPAALSQAFALFCVWACGLCVPRPWWAAALLAAPCSPHSDLLALHIKNCTSSSQTPSPNSAVIGCVPRTPRLAAVLAGRVGTVGSAETEASELPTTHLAPLRPHPVCPPRLMNKLQPGSVPKINLSMQNWHQVRGWLAEEAWRVPHH